MCGCCCCCANGLVVALNWFAVDEGWFDLFFEIVGGLRVAFGGWLLKREEESTLL